MTKFQLTIASILIASSTLGFSSTDPLQKNAASLKNYKLDTKRSRILWKGPNSVGNKHQGHLIFSSGSLVEISSGRYGSASFVINMQSILTTDDGNEKDNQKVTEMLKNDNFFGVKKFPTAKITIKRIESTTIPLNYSISGDLTIKGITKPIDFTATLKKVRTTITAIAKLNIDRKKWGINVKKTNDPFAYLKDQMIADEIPIRLDLVFILN